MLCILIGIILKLDFSITVEAKIIILTRCGYITIDKYLRSRLTFDRSRLTFDLSAGDCHLYILVSDFLLVVFQCTVYGDINYDLPS